MNLSVQKWVQICQRHGLVLHANGSELRRLDPKDKPKSLQSLYSTQKDRSSTSLQHSRINVENQLEQNETSTQNFGSSSQSCKSAQPRTIRSTTLLLNPKTSLNSAETGSENELQPVRLQYVGSDLQLFFWFIFFVLSQALIGVVTALWCINNSSKSPFCGPGNTAYVLGRVGGNALLFLVILIPFPHLVKLLCYGKRLGLTRWFPSGKSQQVSSILWTFFTLWTILHMFSHIVGGVHSEGKGVYNAMNFYSGFGLAVLSLAIGVAMAVTRLNSSKRACLINVSDTSATISRRFAILTALIACGCIVHTIPMMWSWNKGHTTIKKYTWLYLCIPILALALERIFEIIQQIQQKCRVLGVEAFFNEILVLQIQKPLGYRYSNGSYVYVTIPHVLSNLKCLLTSSELDPFLRLHVSLQPNNCNRLFDWCYELAEQGTLQLVHIQSRPQCNLSKACMHLEAGQRESLKLNIQKPGNIENKRPLSHSGDGSQLQQITVAQECLENKQASFYLVRRNSSQKTIIQQQSINQQTQHIDARQSVQSQTEVQEAMPPDYDVGTFRQMIQDQPVDKSKYIQSSSSSEVIQEETTQPPSSRNSFSLEDCFRQIARAGEDFEVQSQLCSQGKSHRINSLKYESDNSLIASSSSHSGIKAEEKAAVVLKQSSSARFSSSHTKPSTMPSKLHNLNLRWDSAMSSDATQQYGSKQSNEGAVYSCSQSACISAPVEGINSREKISQIDGFMVQQFEQQIDKENIRQVAEENGQNVSLSAPVEHSTLNESKRAVNKLLETQNQFLDSKGKTDTTSYHQKHNERNSAQIDGTPELHSKVKSRRPSYTCQNDDMDQTIHRQVNTPKQQTARYQTVLSERGDSFSLTMLPGTPSPSDPSANPAPLARFRSEGDITQQNFREAYDKQRQHGMRQCRSQQLPKVTGLIPLTFDMLLANTPSPQSPLKNDLDIQTNAHNNGAGSPQKCAEGVSQEKLSFNEIMQDNNRLQDQQQKKRVLQRARSAQNWLDALLAMPLSEVKQSDQSNVDTKQYNYTDVHVQRGQSLDRSYIFDRFNKLQLFENYTSDAQYHNSYKNESQHQEQACTMIDCVSHQLHQSNQEQGENSCSNTNNVALLANDDTRKFPSHWQDVSLSFQTAVTSRRSFNNGGATNGASPCAAVLSRITEKSYQHDSSPGFGSSPNDKEHASSHATNDDTTRSTPSNISKSASPRHGATAMNYSKFVHTPSRFYKEYIKQSQISNKYPINPHSSSVYSKAVQCSTQHSTTIEQHNTSNNVTKGVKDYQTVLGSSQSLPVGPKKVNTQVLSKSPSAYQQIAIDRLQQAGLLSQNFEADASPTSLYLSVQSRIEESKFISRQHRFDQNKAIAQLQSRTRLTKSLSTGRVKSLNVVSKRANTRLEDDQDKSVNSFAQPMSSVGGKYYFRDSQPSVPDASLKSNLSSPDVQHLIHQVNLRDCASSSAVGLAPNGQDLKVRSNDSITKQKQNGTSLQHFWNQIMQAKQQTRSQDTTSSQSQSQQANSSVEMENQYNENCAESTIQKEVSTTYSTKSNGTTPPPRIGSMRRGLAAVWERITKQREQSNFDEESEDKQVDNELSSVSRNNQMTQGSGSSYDRPQFRLHSVSNQQSGCKNKTHGHGKQVHNQVVSKNAQTGEYLNTEQLRGYLDSTGPPSSFDVEHFETPRTFHREREFSFAIQEKLASKRCSAALLSWQASTGKAKRSASANSAVKWNDAGPSADFEFAPSPPDPLSVAMSESNLNAGNGSLLPQLASTSSSSSYPTNSSRFYKTSQATVNSASRKQYQDQKFSDTIGQNSNEASQMYVASQKELLNDRVLRLVNQYPQNLASQQPTTTLQQRCLHGSFDKQMQQQQHQLQKHQGDATPDSQDSGPPQTRSKSGGDIIRMSKWQLPGPDKLIVLDPKNKKFNRQEFQQLKSGQGVVSACQTNAESGLQSTFSWLTTSDLKLNTGLSWYDGTHISGRLAASRDMTRVPGSQAGSVVSLPQSVLDMSDIIVHSTQESSNTIGLYNGSSPSQCIERQVSDSAAMSFKYNANMHVNTRRAGLHYKEGSRYGSRPPAIQKYRLMKYQTNGKPRVFSQLKNKVAQASAWVQGAWPGAGYKPAPTSHSLKPTRHERNKLLDEHRSLSMTNIQPEQQHVAVIQGYDNDGAHMQGNNAHNINQYSSRQSKPQGARHVDYKKKRNPIKYLNSAAHQFVSHQNIKDKKNAGWQPAPVIESRVQQYYDETTPRTLPPGRIPNFHFGPQSKCQSCDISPQSSKGGQSSTTSPQSLHNLIGKINCSRSTSSPQQHPSIIQDSSSSADILFAQQQSYGSLQEQPKQVLWRRQSPTTRPGVVHMLPAQGVAESVEQPNDAPLIQNSFQGEQLVNIQRNWSSSDEFPSTLQASQEYQQANEYGMPSRQTRKSFVEGLERHGQQRGFSLWVQGQDATQLEGIEIVPADSNSPPDVSQQSLPNTRVSSAWHDTQHSSTGFGTAKYLHSGHSEMFSGVDGYQKLPQPIIYLDTAHQSAGCDIFKHDVAILIAYGAGIIAYLPYLRHVAHLAQNESQSQASHSHPLLQFGPQTSSEQQLTKKYPRTILIWAVPSQSWIEMAKVDIAFLQSTSASQSIEVRIFITKQTIIDDCAALRNALRLQALYYHSQKKDIFTGLKDCGLSHIGAPDWSTELCYAFTVAEQYDCGSSIGCFISGNQAFAQQVKTACEGGIPVPGRQNGCLTVYQYQPLEDLQ